MYKRIKGFSIVAIIACWIAVGGAQAAKDYLYIPSVNSLHIIDCATDTVIKKIPYNDYIVNATFSPDGKRYYLNAIHSVYVIDTQTDTLVDQHKFSSPLSKTDILGLAVSNNGKQLYLACNIVKKKQNIPRLNVLPPQLIVYDLAKRKIVRNHEIPITFSGIVTLRNDDDKVFVVGLDIHTLDLKSGKLTKMMGLTNPEKGADQKNSLVVWQNNSPGDHGIFTNPYYTATGMGYFIIDKNNGKLSTLEGKDIWFEYSTTLSADKKYLYGAMDELIKMDMATGETIKMVPLQQGTCYTLNLTADGKKVYVGPAGADISVYDTADLKLLGVIQLDGDGVIAHRLTK